MSGFKFPVEINWISNVQNLEKDILSMDRRISTITKAFFGKEYLKFTPEKRVYATTEALKKYNEVWKDLFKTFDKMNQKGELNNYFMAQTGYKPKGKGQILTPKQLSEFTTIEALREIQKLGLLREEEDKQKRKEQADYEKYAYESPEEKSKADAEYQKGQDKLYNKNLKESVERFNKVIRPYEKAITKQVDAINIKYKKGVESADRIGEILEKGIIGQSASQKKQQDRERNKNEKNIGNLLRKILQGKWGSALGATVAGAVAYGSFRVLKRGLGYSYTTSQEALDWQRTVSGGASGGNWFGKDIAAYQRAGIGAGALQGFKRGVQSYMGQVKLGMGNAAPLMYLGLSALDNPDEMEVQLEKALRRIGDKSVSLALAQQMGLDYKMWEAIYSGRLERERSFYSEEAMRQWSEVAKNLNDLITTFKVFFFNNLAEPMEKLTRFLADREHKLSRDYMMEHPFIGGLINYLAGTSHVPGALAPVGGMLNVVVKVLGLPDGTQTQVTDTQYTFSSPES